MVGARRAVPLQKIVASGFMPDEVNVGQGFWPCFIFRIATLLGFPSRMFLRRKI